MKALVTGANGLLGQKLYLLLTKQDNTEVVACSKGVNKNSFISTDYLELDITDKISVNLLAQSQFVKEFLLTPNHGT